MSALHAPQPNFSSEPGSFICISKETKSNSSFQDPSCLWSLETFDAESVALISKSNSLQDELAFGNSQVRAEFDRWQTDRRAETIATLSTLTSAYVEYWSLIADAWRDSVRTLDGSEAARTAGSTTTTTEADMGSCNDFDLKASTVSPVDGTNLNGGTHIGSFES
ncbi:unnamed protein product [Schistocephalus solidus]|uniref:Uncharacterized protein n=1 Tax=Schistocephalus solidus TaxID=70667 RepID=A0A183TDE0_SCHSO|nr:unnamed protein product [Schistocephalus solidus]